MNVTFSSQSKTNMTDETRQVLKRWLWADYMLYDHFKAKLERAIKNFDESFMATRYAEIIDVYLLYFVLCWTSIFTNF